MFGIKRWDPGSGKDGDPKPSSSQVDLNAKIAAKRGLKRKRTDEGGLFATSATLATTDVDAATPSEFSTAVTAGPDTADALPSARLKTRKARARANLGLTGGNALPLPAEPQVKTKAKQKYLKKKKDRRKARERSSRAANVSHKKEDTAAVDNPASGAQPVTTLQSPPQDRSPPLSVAEPAGVPQERPRNRPKNLDKTLARVAKAAAARPPAAQADVAPLPATHPGALPRFPEPQRPAPPDLALLGRLARGLGNEDEDDPAQELRIAPEVTADIVAMLRSSTTDAGTETPKHPEQRGILSSHMVQRLKEIGIEHLFAVQTAVIPMVLSGLDPAHSASTLYPERPARDLCVTAPTGSGKTLGYVVPIVETLRSRTVARLRALVLVPTMDLVHQVQETFASLAKGTTLRAVAVSGQHTLAHEKSIIAPRDRERAGASAVDVIVATPGRLLDHLDSDPPLDLQHLRFLVVDEADRIMSQAFQRCLTRLDQLLSAQADPARGHGLPGHHVAGVRRSITQKLLFSATLGHEPSKLTSTRLHRPVFVVVADEHEADGSASATFALPPGLKEHYTVADPEIKPLLLFHLLQSHGIRRALCFCKSVDAAARLTELAKRFAAAQGQQTVTECISGDLPGRRRAQLLAAFQAGQIQILVCSDLVARGVDLPDVEHVISYDAPVDTRKYVHRVGRTARAGKEGTAWTLVERQEALHFKQLLRDLGRKAVKHLRVAPKSLEPLEGPYRLALADLARSFGRSTG